MESGGVIAPERAALRMTALDLAIEVKPGDETIWGVATLTLSTSAPQKILYIDLDKNFPVTAISIDGKPLKGGTWATFKQLWPISAGDVLINPKLVQNPGYN